MPEETPIESILVADCGAVTTKVLLLERVEDQYRFVAQAETTTTLDTPWEDISAGVVDAVEELERITGRAFFAEGRLITPREGLLGVDAFVVILSAAEPLRVILAGLVREMSLESARRVAMGTYTTIEAQLFREGSLRSPEEAWARAVRDLAPDTVLLVGGVDGGASRPVMELADAIALGASMLTEKQRPHLFYAGNVQLRSRITKLLGNLMEVDVVDNIRPEADVEYLGSAQALLEQEFVERRLRRLPGADVLEAWSGFPFQSTAAAFGHVVEFLWHREQHTDRGTLGIDVGAASTTVMACFEGRLYPTVCGGEGFVYNSVDWDDGRNLARLRRWLPEEMTSANIRAFLLNRLLHPLTAPQTLTELWLEQAITREMLRAALKAARSSWNVGGAGVGEAALMPHLDPILISGGGIVNMPRPGHALLTLLDGVQPVGISTILLDVRRAAPALGAVAALKPLAAASALEAGTLVSLGTVISPVGRGRPGEVILAMKINYDDGSHLSVEAREGELEIWPLLPGQRATLELKPARHVDVGLGGPGKGGKIQALGGLIGLVVDGRGRPLSLPADAEERRRLLRRWIWDVGG
ncbi:MAG: glutamate mutase L [Anaerolineae bacterium]